MDDGEVETILRVLRRVQEEGNYSLRGFAQHLGLSAGQLSMVLSGRRQPGIRFLRAAVERIPEIRQLVALYLRRLEGDDEGSWL